MNAALIRTHLGFEPAKLVASLQAKGLVTFAAPVPVTSVGRPPKTAPASLYAACVNKTGAERIRGREMRQHIHLMGFDRQQRRTIQRIVDAVCEEWQVTPGQLVSQDKFQCLIWPRFITLYLLWRSGLDEEQAARVLRRHRTLLVNVKQRVAYELATYPESRESLGRLAHQLNLTLEAKAS